MPTATSGTWVRIKSTKQDHAGIKRDSIAYIDYVYSVSQYQILSVHVWCEGEYVGKTRIVLVRYNMIERITDQDDLIMCSLMGQGVI